MQICKCKVEVEEVIHQKILNHRLPLKVLVEIISLIPLLLRRFPGQMRNSQYNLRNRVNLFKVRELAKQRILLLALQKIQITECINQLCFKPRYLLDQSKMTQKVRNLDILLFNKMQRYHKRNLVLNKKYSMRGRCSIFHHLFSAQEQFQKLSRKRKRRRIYQRKVLNTLSNKILK